MVKHERALLKAVEAKTASLSEEPGKLARMTCRVLHYKQTENAVIIISSDPFRSDRNSNVKLLPIKKFLAVLVEVGIN